MKILFNQKLQTNLYKLNFHREEQPEKIQITGKNNAEYSALSNLSLTNFPNVSFRSLRFSPDMRFLLKQSDRLNCAYSDKKLLQPEVYQTIYQKLEKRPNAQSAINLLQSVQSFMHEIESDVFEMLKDAPLKTKFNFQNILEAESEDSLPRLKEKQLKILTSANAIINSMHDEKIAKKVIAIRDCAIAKMQDDTFGRKSPLDKLRHIGANTEEDTKRLWEIYKLWYKLPRSVNNFDAFVVSGAKQPHEIIARKLICTAVATIEHLTPQFVKKDDSLKNLALVCARHNNDRDNDDLGEYIELNDEIDISKNLQLHVNDLVKECEDKKSPFYDKSWYPEAFRDKIYEETHHTLLLDIDHQRLTKNQVKANHSPHKLCQKYSKYHH